MVRMWNNEAEAIAEITGINSGTTLAQVFSYATERLLVRHRRPRYGSGPRELSLR